MRRLAALSPAAVPPKARSLIICAREPNEIDAAAAVCALYVLVGQLVRISGLSGPTRHRAAFPAAASWAGILTGLVLMGRRRVCERAALGVLLRR